MIIDGIGVATGTSTWRGGHGAIPWFPSLSGYQRIADLFF